MEFSIVYTTYRPGGLDILADSLKNQTMKDYELIIVDDHPVDRSKMVKDYLEKQGIPVAYMGPSKPKCFPEVAFNVFNAINTGLLLSTKEVVILLQDYIWLHPDWLEKIARHENLLRQNYCVIVPGYIWDDERLKDNNALIGVWDRYWRGTPEQQGCSMSTRWVPEGWEFSCIAMPWSVITETNGWPECFDCYAAHPLEPIVKRFEAAGGKPFVDTGSSIEMINHRNWEPSELWSQSKREPTGSTEFIERDNCFDLKHHIRGKAYWLETAGEDIFQNPDYWCGKLGYRPGPAGVGYSDFPIHQVKVDYILSRRPQGKVLDIGCIPAGSPVVTEESVVPIEEIRPGVKVLTHTGKCGQVENISTRCYAGEVIEVQPRYSLPLQLTPEHPVLVADIKRKFRSWKGSLSEPHWVEAKDLKPTMAVAAAIPNGEKREILTIPLPNGRMFRRFLDLLSPGEAVRVNQMVQRFDQIYKIPINFRTAGVYLSRAVQMGILQRLKKRRPTINHPQVYRVIHKPGWCSSEFQLTAQLMRFFGYFVGDGSADERKTTGRVTIAFNKRENRFAQDVKNIVNSTFDQQCHIEERGGALRVVFHRKGIGTFFQTHFGQGAHQKRIPSWLFSESEDLIREFLTGLIRADGHVEEQRISITTVSQTLAYQLQLLLGRLGVVALVQSTLAKSHRWGKREIKGGVRYDVRFPRASRVLLNDNLPLQNRSYSFGWVNGNMIWFPIKSIRKIPFTGSVHNLEVEGSHSYQSNFIVHNCAYGYIGKRLRDKGVDAWGIDISAYALSQAPSEVKPYLKLASADSLPFQNNEFDIAFSASTFEHLPPEIVPKAISEAVRVANRGIISVTPADDPHFDEDITHKTKRPLSWWRRQFPAQFEVRNDADEMWLKMRQVSGTTLQATMQWADYELTTAAEYFLLTRELFNLEQALDKEFANSLHASRRFEYPWAYFSLMPFFLDDIILEAGAGKTVLQLFLSQKVKQVHSLDTLADSIDWVKEMKAKYARAPDGTTTTLFTNIFPILGDLTNMTFASDYFDKVICISTLEHLGKDKVIGGIEELIRVTKPGGKIAITMDIVLERTDKQTDFTDFADIAKRYSFAIPEFPQHGMKLSVGPYFFPFAVACILIKKGVAHAIS